MDVERRIFRSTLWLTAGQATAQLANFVFAILIARAFGASWFGTYSFAMALGALLSVFVSLGTNTMSVREISRDARGENHLLGPIVPLQLASGTVMAVLLFAVVPILFENPVEIAIVISVALFHIVSKWIAMLNSRFRAREQMFGVAASEGGVRLLVLLFGGMLLLLGAGPASITIVMPVSALLVFTLVALAGVRKFGGFALSFSPSEISSTLSRAWPYLSVIIVTVVYGRLGIILLRVLDSESSVGYFASAERLIVPVVAVYAVFVSAIFPAVSRLLAVDRAGADALIARALRVSLIALLPGATLGYLFSDDIIGVLFGPSFARSAPVLATLTWVIALRGLSSFFSTLIAAAGMQKRLALVKLLALAVFGVLSVLLIVKQGYFGLAWAILISEGLLMVLLGSVLHRAGLIQDLAGVAWRPVSCSVLTLVAGELAAESGFFVRLVSVTAVFAATGFALRLFRDLRIR